MRRSLWLVACASLLSTPAFAGWHVCGATGEERDRLFPDGQNYACYDFTATGDTDTIDVTHCGTISVSLFTDTSGSTGTATAQVYSCSVSQTSTTGCEKVLADTDADGLPNDTTLNGDPTALRFGISDVHPTHLIVDVTAASTSYGRLSVSCKP